MAETFRAYTEPVTSSKGNLTRVFLRSFVLSTGVAITIFYLIPSERIFGWLLAALAYTVGGLASAVGVDAIVSGSLVVIPGNFGIEVAVECSGIPELLIFLCAVVAFPTSARSRLAGVIIAFAGVMVGNVLRLTALFLVGVRIPEYFDLVHAYVQGILSYVLMAVLWLGWLRLSATRAAT